MDTFGQQGNSILQNPRTTALSKDIYKIEHEKLNYNNKKLIDNNYPNTTYIG